MATVRSATASDTMNMLGTDRSGGYCTTLMMTSMLPNTVITISAVVTTITAITVTMAADPENAPLSLVAWQPSTAAAARLTAAADVSLIICNSCWSCNTTPSYYVIINLFIISEKAKFVIGQMSYYTFSKFKINILKYAKHFNATG